MVMAAWLTLGKNHSTRRGTPPPRRALAKRDARSARHERQRHEERASTCGRPHEAALARRLHRAEVDGLQALDHGAERDGRSGLHVHDVDREWKSPLQEQLPPALVDQPLQEKGVVPERHLDPESIVRIAVEELVDAAIEDVDAAARSQDREIVDRLDVDAARNTLASDGFE